jgi:hypothetical protein
MSDEPCGFEAVIDCSGLHEIAGLESDNFKSLFLDQLAQGVIGVPVCVWSEFEEIYPDEASSLKPYVTVKIRMTQAYRVGAARNAEKLNSGFSRGAYDSNADLYAAAIASIEECTLITVQSSFYGAMDCEVSDLDGWAD